MPKENFTEELKKVLISEIEVSEERASEILEKTKLSAIKPEELRERLKFLKNEIGYTNNEISKVVDKFDRVLSYNVQKMSSALKEFSDCFGTELEESKAYFREEIRCIGYDYKKIKTNKEEFEQVYKKYNKGKAFSKSPKSLIHLAMQDEDRRKKRQEFISKNLNVSLDEAILLMIEFPPSSSIREDVFLDKIAMAEKLMGYKDYVVQNPYILTANPIDLKFRFAMFAIECKTIGDFAKRKFFAFSTAWPIVCPKFSNALSFCSFGSFSTTIRLILQLTNNNCFKTDKSFFNTSSTCSVNQLKYSLSRIIPCLITSPIPCRYSLCGRELSVDKFIYTSFGM